MNMHKIVVTEQSSTCGAVVYWSLAGGVNISALEDACRARDLNPSALFSAPTPERALTRAIRTLADRSHIVRQLPDGTGWALVAEKQVDAKASDYATTMRAYIEKDGSIAIEPKGHPDAERLMDAFDASLTSLDAGILADVLINTCRALRAVSLRPMGGVYFLPSDKLESFNAIASAIEEASGSHVWQLPAMRSEDAARAILAAVAEEAEHEVSRMEAELEESSAGSVPLGARAISTREARAAALRAKVAEYEGLLGGSLDAVRERLERAQAALAAAALAAASEKEGA